MPDFSPLPPANSHRRLRVGEVLRRRLAELLRRNDMGIIGVDATLPVVTQVVLSPDLRFAKVYIRPLHGDRMEVLIESLNAQAAPLRKAVMRGMRLKFSPALKFCADTSFDYGRQMEHLLDSPAVRRDTQTS